jgi:fatty-acyl-CoA synthase
MTTLTGWLRELATTHGERDALLEPGGQWMSFAALDRRVAALAGALRSADLGAGDRLVSFVPNGILPVELLLAAARLGAITIGVNTRYRSDDLRHLLDQARPRLLVASPAFLGIDFPAIVAGALHALEAPPAVVWADTLAERRERADPVADDTATASDVAIAFTTSGTTGQPKVAAHDHATTVRHLRAASRSLEVQPGDTTLLALPFCGTFGFVSLLAVLSGGARAVVPDRFDPASAAMLVEQHRVTHLNGSDDMLLAIVDQGRDLRSWRHGVHADFNGHGHQAVAAVERVGARITGVYGSSETFALLARWSPVAPIEERARNGGVPVDHANEVRVVDTRSGQGVGPDVVGELHVRGPSLLSGYLVPDGMTPPPLDHDGWFATGDLGLLDPRGGFIYQARTGDALRLRGFLTDPTEIEQHLMAHPSVSGAHVVGATGPAGGDVAVAFVTSTAPVGEQELLAYCRDGLANYKVPARVVIVDTFPTIDGANGVKVRKTELRQHAALLSLRAPS